LPTVPLPDDPSFEQLRKQAKDLRGLAGAGVPGALDLVAEHHPNGRHAVTLTGAQLVVARHYGFSSWASLKRHIETIQHYRRAPDEVDASGGGVDEFLSLACLRYGDDTPDRWERAARILGDRPNITKSNVHAAAAIADVDALTELLAADAGLARKEGGPYAWEPLLYLAYSRVPQSDPLAAATVLLDHGADPNAGYLWHGLTSPFTALTGAFGSGEGDQPEHEEALALAELLLQRGADANDGQALYNRQFRADDSHLRLLFAYGLGRGDGGPWRARLGSAVDSPQQMIRTQLWWAIVHDMRDRVQLLADNGVDMETTFSAPGGRPTWARTSDGRTPVEVAALAGCPELVDWFVARGAARPAAAGVDGLIAAVLAGDVATTERLSGYVEEAKAQRPGLIVWAAARDKHDAVRVLATLGFDVNAMGRSDVPMEQAWETALHVAAGNGDVQLARVLLDIGADPNIEDARFQSTPLGWARHFEQPEIVELLEPTYTAESSGPRLAGRSFSRHSQPPREAE
jgi:Ankyrin repeats (3 copies)